jgi:hypothetical protein
LGLITLAGDTKRKKEKDRFLYVGIVDKKIQDGAGNPHPPLSNYSINYLTKLTT